MSDGFDEGESSGQCSSDPPAGSPWSNSPLDVVIILSVDEGRLLGQFCLESPLRQAVLAVVGVQGELSGQQLLVFH